MRNLRASWPLQTTKMWWYMAQVGKGFGFVHVIFIEAKQKVYDIVKHSLQSKNECLLWRWYLCNLLHEEPSHRETKRDRKTREFQYKGGRGLPIADYKNVLLAMVLWQRNPWIKHYDKNPSPISTTNKSECQSMHSVRQKMFILVINQLDAQNLFYNKFISCLYMFRAPPIGGRPVQGTATYRCDDTRGCIIQFWPPDDEHMCSKHVEAWYKRIVK